MTTKQILRDSATFTIQTVAPDTANISAGVDVTITDTAGTVLVNAAAATVATSATTSTAATAGRRTIALTDAVGLHAPAAGEHFRLGSSSQGWQYLTVVSYASSTRTITTDDFIERAFASGSAVQWRDVSYELDTTAAAWDDLDEVTIEFIPQIAVVDGESTTYEPDPDQIPWTELWNVVKRASAVGALEAEFRAAYPAYHEAVPSGSFNALATRAQHRLRNYFQARGRDFARIIDSEALKEPWLTQMAVLIAMSGSERFADELKILQTDLNAQLAQLDSLSIWTDFDQDKIKDDDEAAPADEPGLCRGL